MSRLLLSGLGLGVLTVGTVGFEVASASAQDAAPSSSYVTDANGFPRAVAAPAPTRYVQVLPGASYGAAAATSTTVRSAPGARPAPPAATGEVIRTAMARDNVPWMQTARERSFVADGHVDRLSVRQQGWIMPADTRSIPDHMLPGDTLQPEAFDVRYTRTWSHTLARSDDGVELAFEPHAGLEIGSRGGAAVTGATVRIGRDLESLVADGSETFGDRQRWYVFAAGSGRAVGYNWARGGDGSYARSGISQDTGVFLGDATLGVAMRQGSVQGSLGLVYREVEVDGLRGAGGIRTDVSEGLVGFQLSIKP